MKKIKDTVLKIGAFGLAPVIISVASIISLPIILHKLGEGVWLSIATGQTAGELARLITIWGWNSVGLSVAASLGERERIKYYLNSIPARVFLFIVSTAIIGIFSYFMPVESKIGFFLMAMAGNILGLAGSWIYIASRDARRLILFDSVPRTAGIIVGALLLLVIPSVYTVALSIIIGNFIATIIPAVHHLMLKKKYDIGLERLTLSSLIQSIQRGFSAFVIGFVMSLRMSLPVLLSPVLIPDSAAVVALADKFMRWGNTGMTPVMQFVQTGIPRFKGSLKEQINRGTKITLVASLSMFILATLATFMLSPLMSAGTIDVSFAMACIVGSILGMVFITTVVGNTSLVLLGKVGTVAKGSVIALVVLVAMVSPAAAAWGAVGIMLAYALSELGIIVFQFVVLNKSLKKLKGE